MTISDNTVAIIGAGNMGGRIAADFAAGGLDFLLAGRDLEATRKLASDLDGHAEAVSVDEAVDRADVLLIAVWLDAFEQLIAQYGERLAGKVIVDPTNPSRRMATAASRGAEGDLSAALHRGQLGGVNSPGRSNRRRSPGGARRRIPRGC